MKWPPFSDMHALVIIMICAFILWPIVGCDRATSTQPQRPPNRPTVEVSTARPIATATLRSTCLIGAAIMGCDD